MNNAPRFRASAHGDDAPRHNRGKGTARQKAGAHVRDIHHMTVWGNHSATQYPDITPRVVGTVPRRVVDRQWSPTSSFRPCRSARCVDHEARILSRQVGARRRSTRSRLGAGRRGELGLDGRAVRRFYDVEEGLTSGSRARARAASGRSSRARQSTTFSRERIDATVNELCFRMSSRTSCDRARTDLCVEGRTGPLRSGDDMTMSLDGFHRWSDDASGVRCSRSAPPRLVGTSDGTAIETQSPSGGPAPSREVGRPRTGRHWRWRIRGLIDRSAAPSARSE